MKKKKIAISGSLGLVGSEAVDFFKEKGWDVIGIDANIRSFLFGTPLQIGAQNFTETHDIDIRDRLSVEQLFINHHFDAIIHTAAQPSHDWAKREPLTDFDINARGTLILLEAARLFCPEATFLYVSTDKVYGERGELPMEELDTRLQPRMISHLRSLGNSEKAIFEAVGWDEKRGLDFAGKRSLFGCSKTAADIYVQEYGNYFGMKTACFRPGCITGKRHQGAEEHGFLAYLTKCIKEKKTYKIFGFRGKQVRDIVHSYDLVNAFWHFIENPKVAAVYNFGGGPERSVSVLEAGEMIAKELNVSWSFEFDKQREGDRQWDVHDISKFRGDYPAWEYKYSLQDIIKELCS